MALRIALAGGPLTLDEAWSLHNLRLVRAPWQVFWKISHDNNHFLNSFWLALVGGTEPWAMRAPSVLMGGAFIVAMAVLGRRRDGATGIAAAILAASGYYFVAYSAEARGYMGATLALALAALAFERALATGSAKARFAMAAWLGIGLFWHLALLPAIPLFGLAAAIEAKRRGATAVAAFEHTMRLMLPTVAAAVPAFACVAAGILATGKFIIGGVTPYAAVDAATGLTGLVGALAGLPAATPAAISACLGAALVAGGLAVSAPARRGLIAVTTLGFPLAVFALRPPNVAFPRYWFV
ncbi:MAG: glycosyltransferase family 39 protein, partial [Hyphomicrobiales bacterium]|nr:glycosyltransferase family 39 protein [Hyphomicrobiales bacterium]